MLSKMFLGYVQWVYFGNMLLVLGTLKVHGKRWSICWVHCNSIPGYGWAYHRNILDPFLATFWMLFGGYLQGICWDHSLNVPKMWLVDTLGKNDPEPTIYPRCSHWFPGHLAPSDSSTMLTDGSLVDKVERHCEDDEKSRVVMKSCWGVTSQ